MVLHKYLFIVTLFISAHFKSNAQDEAVSRNMHSAGINAAITSSDTWQLEAAYHWFPIRYVGIGGGIGYWKQFCTDAVPQGKYWRVNEKYQLPSNLYFHPSLLFFSPTVVKGSDFAVRLFAEPGLMLGIPYDKVCIDVCSDEYLIPYAYKYVSSNKGNWCFFDARIGVSAKIEPLNISVGYIFSTLDVYAMRRNMAYENLAFSSFYPKAKDVHGVYMTVAFDF